MVVVNFEQTHVESFLRFASELPDGDVTFIKEPFSNPETVLSWAEPGAGQRWVALDGDSIIGFLAVLRLPGWVRPRRRDQAGGPSRLPWPRPGP